MHRSKSLCLEIDQHLAVLPRKVRDTKNTKILIQTNHFHKIVLVTWNQKVGTFAYEKLDNKM